MILVQSEKLSKKLITTKAKRANKITRKTKWNCIIYSKEKREFISHFCLFTRTRKLFIVSLSVSRSLPFFLLPFHKKKVYFLFFTWIFFFILSCLRSNVVIWDFSVFFGWSFIPLYIWRKNIYLFFWVWWEAPRIFSSLLSCFAHMKFSLLFTHSKSFARSSSRISTNNIYTLW